MKTMLSVALLATSAFTTPLLAQTAPDWAPQADALLERHFNAATPGVTVIVTRDGEVIYQRGAGMADLEAGVAADTDTVYRLASVTKHIASAALLQLVDAGQVSLDDTVADYLPDYPEPGASATIRQLLNHTSGIQSYTGIPGWMVEANTARAYTTAELIAEFADQPAQFQPGESWSYNNSGYVLVGAVIEAATGQDWHRVVEERISAPLGLETLRYGGIEDQVAEMAAGYTLGEDGETVTARAIDMSVPHAAGALIANTEDLAAWAHALHGGEVISDALYAQMIAPTILPDGTEIDYGFGLVPDDVRGRESISHGGGIFGFSTYNLYVPGDNVFVATFANTDSPALRTDVIARRMASFAIGDPYPVFTEIEADPESFEAYFGEYQIDGGPDTRQFYARDGQLYTQREGSESVVYAAGDDRFFYGANSLSYFEMLPSEDGAHVMNMHSQGASDPVPAVWTGPVPDGPETIELPAETLSRYVGDYSLGAGTLTVRFADASNLEAQMTGQPAFAIAAVGETEFLVQGVSARLVFDAGDRAPAVTLLQGGREMRAGLFLFGQRIEPSRRRAKPSPQTSSRL